MKTLFFSTAFSLLLCSLAGAGSWDSVSNTPFTPTYPDYAYSFDCNIELSDRKTHFTEKGEEYILVARLVTEMSKPRGTDRNSIVGFKKTKSSDAWQVYRYYRSPLNGEKYQKTAEVAGFNLDAHQVRLYIHGKAKSQGQSQRLEENDQIVFDYSIAQKLADRTARWSGREQRVSTKNKVVSGVVKATVDYKSGVPSLGLEMHVDCKRTSF